MDDSIHYLNTDLELRSTDDLTALAAAFEARGMLVLHLGRTEEGLWHAAFETSEQHAEPEPTITAFLAVVESLAEPLRATWRGCRQRVFDIGYACGSTPMPFHQDLSSALLGRVAAAGVSLGLTLYPPEAPTP